jgi:hypothetical protein
MVTITNNYGKISPLWNEFTFYKKERYWSIIKVQIRQRGHRGVERMVIGFTCVQSVPITTKVVSLNPAHGEVYPCVQGLLV